MQDPKYLGIPNICFSLTERDDHREEKFSIQRMQRGFDDSELWSLRDTIGNFILPRLKRFAEISPSTPGNISDKQWRNILLKMITAFELLTRDHGSFILNEKEERQFNKGMKLFNEWFLALWY